MKKAYKGIIKRSICVIFALLFVFSLTACGKKETSEKAKKTEIGEGENNFTAIIYKSDDPEDRTIYEVRSDEVTVGDAMAENGLLETAETADGQTYVCTVDGKTVDYNKDKKFWVAYQKGDIPTYDICGIGIMCSEIYIFEIQQDE